MKNGADDLWARAWQLLRRGAADRKHRFNTGTLTTLHSTNGKGEQQVMTPRSRTIVLRKVDLPKATLLAYTDRRSAKATAIEGGQQRVSWCFWDPKSSVQFTCQGIAQLDVGPATQRVFHALPKHSRKAYATLSAPGTIQKAVTDDLPSDWAALDLKQTDYAASNFGLLTTTLLEAEVLFLSRDGHQKIRATRSTDGTWDVAPVAP